MSESIKRRPMLEELVKCSLIFRGLCLFNVYWNVYSSCKLDLYVHNALIWKSVWYGRYKIFVL